MISLIQGNLGRQSSPVNTRPRAREVPEQNENTLKPGGLEAGKLG